MIISHSHRFLFVKSIKTAGTSVEAALSGCCSGDDVVTPLNDFSHNRDETGGAAHHAMNFDKLAWWDREIGQHVDASTMRQHLPPEVWKDYFKFSIARNPWDRVVSLFSWRTRNNASMKPHKRLVHRLGMPYDELGETRRHFATFVRHGIETNDRFYFENDDFCVDFVIRYEHLAEDLDGLRQRLSLPALVVPRLKSGIRPGAFHYSQYYDDATRQLVADLHRNDIRQFGYRFENA